MIAFVYFMKLFDSDYFKKISQKCENSNSFSTLLKDSASLYIRVMLVPIVSAQLCIIVASNMPHWILAGTFIIEAIEFIVLFCVGTFIANGFGPK